MLPDRRASRVIPGLDGLRAVSILCVLYGHLVWTPSFHGKLLLKLLDPAGLGVQIFFVISGFLITTLLLEEKHLSGDISLRNRGSVERLGAKRKLTLGFASE